MKEDRVGNLPEIELLKKLLKSPVIMASGISTKFLPENRHELCDKLKLSLQEKQAGNISDIINHEIVAIVDKLFEYKCISKKQQNQLLIKCDRLH